jgi:UDP-2,3-diacylglucosamine pyrophosphatase LpxH
MSPRRAVILSDVHLGPAGPLSTFHEGRALATFIAGLAAAQEPATELVLAGDVFDFLQTEGYDGFRADLAAERFQRILAGPETWPVMDALRTFGRRSGSEITLLAGNHDPEVLLDDVRGAFEQAIGRKGSVRYADDEPLAPGIGDRWPVWGRALGNAAGTVWVVHGDRWDPHNAIHRDALRTAVAEGHPVALPTGSQLVYQVLSQLQPENRWIPELKPEFPVVFPLLLYLDPRVTLPFLEEHWGLTEQLLRGYVNGQLHLGPLFDGDPGTPGSAVTPELLADVERSLPALLAEAIREEAPGDPDALLAELQTFLAEGPAPAAEGTLAQHSGTDRVLLRAWLKAARWTERFQDDHGPDGILDAAQRWLPNGLVALVAGHTHGPRRRPGDPPAYYNTGTWTRVGRLPQGPLKDVIDTIEAGQWEAEAPRTFVTVTWDDGPPAVALGRCDAQGRPVEMR